MADHPVALKAEFPAEQPLRTIYPIIGSGRDGSAIRGF
jgi:hypothetical protein